MDTKALHQWAELLLDTGKRNHLINFRASRTGTAEIVAPDFDALFRQAEHAAVLEVFDPKTEKEDSELFERAFSPSDSEKNPVLSKEQYRSLYAHKLKKGQVLVYNSANKPMQALKSISKRGRTAIEETGVNILYLAFGFVKWREEEEPQSVMKAPLLLVPVSIENESALEAFRIRIADDDIIVNPTFSFKLQSEFGFSLPAFEEESSVSYFDTVEQLVSKLGWSVARECALGVFSFLKLNMYQDLKDNADTIAKSTNVRTLMGESPSDPAEADEGGSDAQEIDPSAEEDATEADTEESPDTPETEESPSAPEIDMELHNVVDADSSQSEAIRMIKRGESFVLQGPPGTGKSQTITNMIAECLSDGKSVLFVSEKLAALNVVYDKLKKAGLDEFCLELHSHKANKKQVIEELYRTLNAERSVVSERAQRELHTKKLAQEKLESYTEELHRPRPVIDKTLYRMYEEVAACRKAPDIPYTIQDIENKGADYIDEACALFERYAEYIPTIGYDYRKNPWYGFDVPALSYEALEQLKEDLETALDLSLALCGLNRDLKDAYGITVAHRRDFLRYHRLFALLGGSQLISSALIKGADLIEALQSAVEMKALAQDILSNKEYLDKLYNESIYQMDGEDLCQKLTCRFSGVFSRLFSSDYKYLILNLRYSRKNGKKPRYADAVREAEALRAYQKAQSAYTEAEQKLAPHLTSAYKGVHTDFGQLVRELTLLSELQDVDYGRIAELSAEEFAARQTEFKELSENGFEPLADEGDAFARLSEQFCNHFDIMTASPDALAEKTEACLQNTDRVDHWLEFLELTEQIRAHGLEEFLHRMLEEETDASLIPLGLRKAFYRQWIAVTLQKTPPLRSFDRVSHDKAVRTFCEKDTLHFDINKAKIRASVSAKRPNPDMAIPGSAMAILIRESEKKRKQKSIRQLLLEIGDLALTLKPCFLMSPLSVSTFLGADMHFDVVIFDEASQIFPQDAIGAIYRGSQLVVVGDSKQMPPSSFFHSSAESEEDGEDESLSDFESVLDLCSVTFPQRRLKWHYRSRYEQLIAFSNKNFYDNDLVTFPSAKEALPGTGVEFCYVDGVFDRESRTNRAEAERVVDLVFEHIKTYPDRSLGVVAFSISQQSLIERLIAQRRQRSPDADAFFRSDRIEPFFVKNLETVQGDERDTILFSIAYARDTKGRLLLNFGPLNRVGGERRLNVAVTRAKHQVRLVTSMHYSDIDLSRTQSEGVRLLREYLCYAESGVPSAEHTERLSEFDRPDLELENEIGEFLRENGYAVDTQVGHSSCKIDLALKHPNAAGYLMAIECDGESYSASASVRDRDRLRPAILENMGWKFYRVWSVDWFKNRTAEEERLLSTLKEISETTVSPTAPLQKSPDTPEADSFTEKAEVEQFSFPCYKEVLVSDIRDQYCDDVQKIVQAILEVEAPVSEEWFLKRLVRLYDRQKVTSVVIEAFEEDMEDCEENGILRRGGFFYLKDKEIPMLRVPANRNTAREIRWIAPEELAMGLRALLKETGSAEKEGLFRLLVHRLSFTRVTESMQEYLDDAFHLLRDEIEVSGKMISLK